jgi:hypothetical protein
MIWTGKPAKTVDEFVNLVNWGKGKPHIQDIYYCLSLQSHCSSKEGGRKSVLRSQAYAMALKSLWLDIDIKPDPKKGYATISDAITALSIFCKKCSLPKPSALIGSGGGLHVYWISKEALPKAEWQRYADGLWALAQREGLRADPVTTDSARILRVPFTNNYKTKPPKPVKVLFLGKPEDDYDFATALSALPALAPVTTTVTQGTQVAPFDLTNFPRKNDKVESLAEGIEHQEYPPLAFAPIIKGCEFIRNALKTGGKDYSQPLWMLTTLASTFMERGHDLAHKMANKHPGYTFESTEAMWQRKQEDRQVRGIGWPSCKAISSAGCASCASCPHFTKGKSPLNLAVGIPPAVTSAALQTIAALHLPKGYALNEHGVICVIVEDDDAKDNAGKGQLVPIFNCVLSHPWPSSKGSEGGDALNFKTTVSKGEVRDVHILLEDMIPGPDMWRKVQRQGVKPVPSRRNQAGDYFMAWISTLHDQFASIKTVSFGWLEEKGKLEGFIYGGVAMKRDGSEGPAGLADPKLRGTYSPCGSIDPWFRACKMITDRKRADLNAIIASAFASPLMRFGAEYSALVSAWGESGTGKSAASYIGLAVWGHPKLTKEGPNATSKKFIKHMGEVRNLPLYWDEIKGPEGQKRVIDVLFNATEGVEGGRLNRGSQMMDQTDWQNLITVCSNNSIVEAVLAQQKTTDAGANRIFEFFVPKIDNEVVGDTMDGSRIIQSLESNYGNIGLRYAKMLAMDPEGADTRTQAWVKRFSAAVHQRQSERYWVVVCGTLMAGAENANALGCEIDLAGLQTYLVQQYMENRKKVAQAGVIGGSTVNTEDVVTKFLKHYAGQHLYTDIFPLGVGRPQKATIIYQPALTGLVRAIEVHWAVSDRTLRFSRRAFADFLETNKIPAGPIMRGLENHMNATVARQTLGSGTQWSKGPEYLWVIPIPAGSSYEQQLFAYDPEARAGLEALPPAEETGIVTPFPASTPSEPTSINAAAAQAAADLNLVRSRT